MSAALEPIGPTPSNHLATVLPMLPDVAEFAKTIANTAFAPDSYRGKPAEITACMFYALELGIGPMTALQKIDVIKGRPAPRAELGRALAMRAGHEIWIDEATNTRVKVSGRRRGSDHISTVTWTMDDAKRAGLAGSATYRAYPRQMLTARATAELVRLIAPDVLAGIDAFAEELDDAAASAQVVDAVTPTTKRKRGERVGGAKFAGPTAAAGEVNEIVGAASKPEPAAIAPAAEQDVPEDAEQPAEAPPSPDVDLNAAPPTLSAPAGVAGPTAAQMKAMHASLTDAGITDRDDRLAFVSAVVGRTVDSSKNITKPEAGNVIDAAQEIAAGTAGILLAEDGTWTITAQSDGTT